jgi:dihydrofolate synthase / folylpolyglutamate synthase
MTYNEALEYMFRQLPMFHRIGKLAYKANLETAVYFDKYFDYPHREYKTIHIAGTNGKGSVSHILAAILQMSGYKTGLFTSPHLKDFRERIRVNGQMISQEEVIDFIENNKPAFEEIQPSFFEMTSALAFYYFKKERVDIAVIEVGMGGRLDSTNVIRPVLSVITNISFDHMEFLGDTLDKIAAEKAGIIKAKTPVVIGQYQLETWPVFSDFGTKMDAPVILADKRYKAGRSSSAIDEKQIFQVEKNSQMAYPDLKLDLAGFYQQKNICTVLAVVDELRELGYHISDEHVYKAMEQVTLLTGLQGRWQSLGDRPFVICDTGHNKDGISWVVEQINAVPCAHLHMVIGFVKDKDISSVLQILPKNAIYYFTNAAIPRALEAGKLAEKAAGYGLHGSVFSSVLQAFEAAKAKATGDDFIFVGGSTFVVAEVV